MGDTAWKSWDDPLSEGRFFGRNLEETNHNKLKYFENALMRQTAVVLEHVRDLEARRFLQHGFLIRHMMMQRSRLEVREQTIERTEPLEPYLAAHLATHLNAYYLNLVGALDNLAWAAAFELHLQDSLSQKSWESRKFCTIASKDFRQALEIERPVLRESISRAVLWVAELKELRDPAAHRLPLTLVSAILTTDDQAAFDDLTREATEAVTAGNLDLWNELMWKRAQLGRFAPILSSPQASDGSLILAPNQIAVDQERFVRFASEFVEVVFDAVG